MAQRSQFRGPNYIHPEKPSAVGSRNSLYRDGRNEYSEAKLIIDEEVDKILNHISTKLPPEVVEKLHVGGTIKDVLHNYFNQGFQNMFNRYLITVEDELAKKLRDLIDNQETENLNQYTPKNVKDLLDSLGGQENFTNYSIETSIATIYGNLQGHIQKAIVNLENKTKKLLREKSEIGYFLDGNQASAILRCDISDNQMKPESVYDVNLILNIVDSELVKPIYHYQIASEVIVKDVLSEHILNIVDSEIEEVNAALVDSSQPELTKNARIFEKIKKLEDHFGFKDQADEESPAYSHMAKKFLDAIHGIEAEIDLIDYDPLNIRENVKNIIDREDIRNAGYNTAVNALISILDLSHLGYQHIENFKNCRKTVIREYTEVGKNELPDENYTLSLSYRDDMQLREERTAFCQQFEEFESETDKLYKVFNKLHESEKRKQGFLEYQDIADQFTVEKKNKKNNAISELNGKKKVWDEVSFVLPEKSDIEKLNETFFFQSRILRKKFKMLRDQITDLYDYEFPPERVIMEQRLNFIESNFQVFHQQYNPFQAHPGLFLEVTLSSVKRREITLSSMSNAISRFIASVSNGFMDSAFDEYHEKKKAALLSDDKAFVSAT